MIRILLVSICLTLAFLTYSQDFRRLLVTVDAGIALPGFSVGVEPAVRLSDKLTLGAKIERSWVFAQADDFHEASSGAVFPVAGYLKYYLNKNPKERVYVGAGAGRYIVEFGRYDYHEFGSFFRVGREARHFSMNLDYNIVGAVDHKGGPSWEFVYANNNYITFRLGIMIGGGYKYKEN